MNEQKGTHGEMYRLNELYNTVLKATNDAIWEWDIPNDKLVWSDNFYALFGYTKDELGQDLKWWEGRIHPEDKGGLLFELNETIHKKQSTFNAEYRFLAENGKYRYVRIRSYLFYNDQGKAIRMIGSMQDIDQLKQNEETLIRQNNLLKEISYTCSHELRRPIASILGLNSLIQELVKNSKPENKELLDLVNYLDTAMQELDSVVKLSILKMNKTDQNL